MARGYTNNPLKMMGQVTLTAESDVQRYLCQGYSSKNELLGVANAHTLQTGVLDVRSL